MKLRYYLRGIGLGIIVAAAICICASLNNKKEMTDAEIMARAEALGMTSVNARLTETTGIEGDVAEETDDTEFQEVAKEEIAEPVVEETVEAGEDEAEAIEVAEEEIPEVIEAVEEAEEVAEEAKEDEASNSVEEAKAEEITEVSKGDIVTIVVDKGNGSDTVARRLADAGLVANASEYDKYLMANGYDRRIAAGTHKIPMGASNEEIAKLLVSKQD